jgi:hypothetical protein
VSLALARSISLLLSSAAVLVLAATGASAQVLQLTSNVQTDCVIFTPASSANGSVMAVESNCDLLGGNADGNREIFLLDRSVPALAQITDSSGCANTAPSIDAAGANVAFDSDCDLSGENSDGSVEIFYWDGNTITQLTDDVICASLAPSLNGAGDMLAFDSNCNLTGSNSDLSNEIFTVTRSGSITQITDDASSSGCGSFNAAVNDQGDVIAFESDCDLAGSNIDGIIEIFRAVVGGAVTQLTVDPDDAGCASTNPSIDATGVMIAFESNCDLTGANADGETEIFRVDDQGGVEQLSDDDGTTACESIAPTISADGGSVMYASYCDPLGANGDGNLEIFEASGALSAQLTQTSGCNSFEPTRISQVDALVFSGDCQFGGGNPENADQAYLLYRSCACGAPVSRGATPVATDALFALSAAVGLTECGPCSCDVDAGGSVTAADALRILNRAVGMSVPLTCS